MKMKSFWEYLLPDGDRKAKKVIHKTGKLANYQAAVDSFSPHTNKTNRISNEP